MSVPPSAQAPDQAMKPSSSRAQQLVAIVYPDNAYPGAAFEALVAQCRGAGLSLAGVLQHRIDETPERRCDVVLDDLSTGHRTAIFEDRGAGAAGCRLDEGALAGAAARIERTLENSPDVLVLNKFGKAECEGGGLLDLIARAMDRNITVVIGVPKSNLGAWRGFAGDLAVELSEDASQIARWVASLR